jgi:hypothetical protein
MAIFTLTDIIFGDKTKTGSATGGQLVGGQYESNLYRFPSDLGNYNRGHYMVIHVNVQEKSQYNFTDTGEAPTIVRNRMDNQTPTLNQATADILGSGVAQEVGTVVSDTMTSLAGGAAKIMDSVGLGVVKDVLGSAGSAIMGAAAEGVKNYSDIRGVRTIYRTTDTIALYMPDTLNFQNNQQYSDLNTSGLPAAAIAGGASAAKTLSSGADAKTVSAALAKNMSPYMLGYVLGQSDFGKSAFATMTGMVQNPMLELLYTSPQFRTFRFDFMFYPKSEKEAEEVQKILSRLKFHQAPELKREFYGFYLVPPSEFDIKFYYNGAINPNIPPISTCVLESIDVNYAPDGFTAYEVPGQTKPTLGGTGMPVAIRLSLQFKETEILTKDNFASGIKQAGSRMFDGSVQGNSDYEIDL